MAAEDVEERRLAGAIGADEADELALCNREGHRVEGLQAPERPADLIDGEAGHGASLRRRGRGRRRAADTFDGLAKEAPQALAEEAAKNDHEQREHDELIAAEVAQE